MELIYPTAHACVKFAKPWLLQVTVTLLIALFAFLTISAISPLQADAGQATLAWDADTSPGVTGYMLHYGTAPGNYSQSIDVGNVTSYTVASLTDGQTYYFAAMAYDSAGQQSGYSNEVSKTVSSTTPATFSITATASGYGSITALNNSNITTSSSGSSIVTTVTLSSGASQTFSITPSSGYQVASVTVDGRSVGAVTTYTFSNVTANHTISATFTANTTGSYTITATAGSNGTITPSGSTAVSSGASQSYTITPNTGYYVVSVVVDGTTVASNLPSGGYTYNFSNVTASHTISANFAIRYFHITASAGTGGTISPTDVWNLYNTSQTVTITPASGYRVADVQVDGTSVGAVGSYTFSGIAADHTISATFATGAANTTVSSYTITASAGSGGSISPSGTVSVAGGSSTSFVIKPNKRFNVSNVLVDGVSVGAVTSYTFGNVTANHSIQASFTRK